MKARVLSLTPTEVRALLRGIRDLRASLGEMLDEAEAAALGNYPVGLYPTHKARHNKILADYMSRGGSYPEVTRADLNRIKRARRALGLPEWWERP